MNTERSFIVAQCTPDESELLRADEEFLKKLTVYQAVQEMELLESHELAMDIAAEKGNTKPIEWRLSKLNPESWGPKSEINVKGDFAITPAPKPDQEQAS